MNPNDYQTLWMISEMYLTYAQMLGDGDKERNIQLLQKGIHYGERAVKANPEGIEGQFNYMATLGSLAMTQGTLASLWNFRKCLKGASGGRVSADVVRLARPESRPRPLGFRRLFCGNSDARQAPGTLPAAYPLRYLSPRDTAQPWGANSDRFRPSVPSIPLRDSRSASVGKGLSHRTRPVRGAFCVAAAPYVAILTSPLNHDWSQS